MQVSDDLYLGRDRGPISGVDRGIGPCARVYTYDIVPAAASATNIAPLQTLAAAGSLALAPGAGSSRVFAYTGNVRITLDVQRSVSLTSANNLSGVTFTVTGHDAYGARLSQTLAGPNAGTVNTQKTFYSVTSVTTSSVATSVSVGAGNAFGLPIAVSDATYVLHRGWAGAFGDDAGTLVVADPAFGTVLTGDSRGTYTPSSAADGTKRLVFTYALSDAQAGPGATNTALVGMDQSVAVTSTSLAFILDGGFTASTYFQSLDAGSAVGGLSNTAVIGGTA